MRHFRTSAQKPHGSEYNSFNDFAKTMGQFPNPVCDSRRLLREIHSLAAESCRRHNRIPEAVKFIHDKARPQIEGCRRAVLALKQADSHLGRAQRICNEIPALGHYWRAEFEEARQSIVCLNATVAGKRHSVISELPPNKRKKSETAEWKFLFKRFDYDRRRPSWKASRTWFLAHLNELLTRFLAKKQTQISKGEYYRLIQAIFRAAFNENKSEATVKVAINRLRKPGKRLR